MNHTKKLIALCSSSFLLAQIPSATSIALASTSEHHSSHGKREKTDSSKNRKALEAKQKAEVIKVFEANDFLHSAFFDFDAKKVVSAAKALSAAIANLSSSEIKSKLQFAKTKLDSFANDNDREELDQNYHLVSMALIHVLQNYDVGSSFNAFSCPMVKKKWVQNTKVKSKVQNPYAPDMKSCGSQDSDFSG